jgi:hypothetical protein
MLEFAGKLLGLSLRTKEHLPFQFPSIIWKGILGQKIDRSDLMVRAWFALPRHCRPPPPPTLSLPPSLSPPLSLSLSLCLAS